MNTVLNFGCLPKCILSNKSINFFSHAGVEKTQRFLNIGSGHKIQSFEQKSVQNWAYTVECKTETFVSGGTKPPFSKFLIH